MSRPSIIAARVAGDPGASDFVNDDLRRFTFDLRLYFEDGTKEIVPYRIDTSADGKSIHNMETVSSGRLLVLRDDEFDLIKDTLLKACAKIIAKEGIPRKRSASRKGINHCCTLGNPRNKRNVAKRWW